MGEWIWHHPDTDGACPRSYTCWGDATQSVSGMGGYGEGLVSLWGQTAPNPAASSCSTASERIPIPAIFSRALRGRRARVNTEKPPTSFPPHPHRPAFPLHPQMHLPLPSAPKARLPRGPDPSPLPAPLPASCRQRKNQAGLLIFALPSSGCTDPHLNSWATSSPSNHHRSPPPLLRGFPGDFGPWFPTRPSKDPASKRV